MKQGNYIHRLFDIMEEFGDDTDIAWTLIRDDGPPAQWFFSRHQEMDGLGCIYLAQKHQGVRIEVPEYKGVVPTTWQRFVLAWRKFRSKTPAPVQWRQWQPSADGRVKKHSQLLHGRLLDVTRSKAVVAAAKAHGITLNSWLLWALNRAVVQVLALDQGERAWGNTVNMRGYVPADKITDNQSSIVTVIFHDADSAEQLHGRLQALFNAGMQWGSWDFLNTICRFGPNLVRKQIRRYYSSNNSQMGTFSNLGALSWEVTPDQAPYMYLTPPSTRTAPVGALAGTFNGRLALGLGLHPFFHATQEQIESIMAIWMTGLLGETPDVSALKPAPVATA